MSPLCSRLPLTAHHTIDVGRIGITAAQGVIGHFRIGAIDNHVQLAADLLAAPAEGGLLLRCHQPIAPLLLDFLGQMAVEARGRRPRLEGIRKDADTLEARRLDELEQFLKLRIGFAGKADDERGPHCQVGDAAAQLADQLLGRCPVDTPLHTFQAPLVDVL